MGEKNYSNMINNYAYAKMLDKFAYAKYKSRQYDEATLACKKSNIANPNSSYPFFLLGWIYKKQKDYSSGISCFSKALEIKKIDDYFFGRGICKYELNDFKSAIDDFKYSIFMEGQLKPNYYWIAKCKYELNDFKNALSELNTAFKLCAKYDSLKKWYKKEYLFSLKAKIQYELDNYEDVIKDLNKAIEINSNNNNHFFLRAEAKYELNDLKGSLDDLNKSLELNSKNDCAWNLKAYLKMKIEDDEGAIKDLNRAIELNPNSDWYFSTRGICKINQKFYQSAIEDFDKALEINPNNEESKKWRTECYLRLNQISSYFYHYFSLKII